MKLKQYLGIVALGLAFGVSAEEPAATPSGDKLARRVTFTAEVRAIQPIGDYEGQAILTHFDPGYVLVVEVDAKGSGDDAIPANGKVAFAVHSPSHVFLPAAGDGERIGRTFRFSIGKTSDPRGTRWRHLVVEKPPDGS